MDSESVNGEDNLYKLPDFEEVKCAQQGNGFDCGLFTIGYMTEAIEKIINGDPPRDLNAPPEPSGALGMRIDIAKLIDENINTNPKHNGKTDSPSDKEEMEADESIEITCDRLDKLINEEIGKPAEKTNNKKNNDKGGEQNNKESTNEYKNSNKQKTNKNDGIGKAGSKDKNKTIEKIINIKDNKERQEEIKTTNTNNNKDNRKR